MSRLCLRPLGIRLRIEGDERVGQFHPCIYVSNHQSQIDYPIAGRIFTDDTLVIASQIGDWPIMGALYRTSGNIVLDRDNPVRAAAALEEAERALRERGLSIWIFAEGTRGLVPGVMGRFRRGAFRLAARTGRPIVPIVISPLKPHTDIRNQQLRVHDVTLRVLEPMYSRGSAVEDEEELRARVRRAMQRVLDEDMRHVARIGSR
jgi:1-acyl-sn-glycerol-3-phosphate acyltransferase